MSTSGASNPEESNPEVGNTEGGAPVFLRVERGEPTAEELAALVAVLAGAAASSARAGSQDPRPRELWGDPVDNLRHNPPLPPRAYVYGRAWR
ncbi:acyl-CoA carboxylase subunit epsilon [Hoyosella sp. G463]|uniref:Acyl-CoA carboxylase subunit epsilon n=1 Tax=Lolliginicoccus lacisalsi TaxID=2742202 RepID=A0A927JCG0_9ACTN|nr:acyl-CoA carboxylase subunit epsilon [Lolliginicoccus lacisalsi]